MVSTQQIAKNITPIEKNSVEPHKKLEAEQRLKTLIAEEIKTVKGRFRCFESPGSSHKIQVKKYKDVPMFSKQMIDGEVYDVPLYVARHLNGIDAVARDINGNVGSCSYPVHGFKWDQGSPMPPSALGVGGGGEMGVPVPLIGIAKRVRRFGFESLEFGVQ